MRRGDIYYLSMSNSSQSWTQLNVEIEFVFWYDRSWNDFALSTKWIQDEWPLRWVWIQFFLYCKAQMVLFLINSVSQFSSKADIASRCSFFPTGVTDNSEQNIRHLVLHSLRLMSNLQFDSSIQCPFAALEYSKQMAHIAKLSHQDQEVHDGLIQICIEYFRSPRCVLSINMKFYILVIFSSYFLFSHIQAKIFCWSLSSN
jgi:hypothetical protein